MGGTTIDELARRLARLEDESAIQRLIMSYGPAADAGLTSFAVLEPDFVKVDISLTHDVDQSPIKQKIIRAMTTLCHEMGMSVVAEGVETRAERDTLVELGCDLLQGYLFARPGPPFPEASW